MGLIELCLLSLLSPQEPQTTSAETAEVRQSAAPTEEPPPGANAPTADPGFDDTGGSDPRKRLQAAEQAGDYAATEELLELAACPDAAVAARAAWLLAHSTNPSHLLVLDKVIASSPHADARLHAMQGLRRKGETEALPTAIAALEDADRRVRTIAVQLLDALRRPTSIEPLLALIETVATSTEPGPATDVQAALLTLADLGATQQLLRMATAIHDGKVEGAGNALAYTFQALSQKLPAANETTLLVAVLGHREALLRRYAITRLAELGSPTAASALEGRLAAEDAELRPLVEIALAQIRDDRLQPPDDELLRAKHNAKAIWARLATSWNGLQPLHQGLVAGIPALLLVILWLLRRAGKRRRNDEDAIAMTAMVAPSEEYLEEQEAAEYAEHYEEDYADAAEGDEYEDEAHDDATFAEQEGTGDDDGADNDALIRTGGRGSGRAHGRQRPRR